MSAFNTCCGFYCSFTSLIGVYFFIILGIMQYRKNPYLLKEKGGPGQDPKQKGEAFFILAAIEFLFCVLCYLCGSCSAKGDADRAEKEKMEELKKLGISDETDATSSSNGGSGSGNSRSNAGGASSGQNLNHLNDNDGQIRT